MGKKDITINDVAKACGVSKTTISRFLNGKYEYMSFETRKRIQTVVEELQYRPSNVAKSLKSRKSGLIGVIVADIGSQFSSILLKGIEDVCKTNGYQVMISNVDNNPSKEKEYIKAFMDNRVEGIIVNTTGYIDDFLIEINEAHVPIVLADRPMNELKIDTVTTDNYHMTYKTIKSLVEKGYENISLFTEEPSKNNVRHLIRAGYLDAMKETLNINAEELIYTIKPSNKYSSNEAIQELNRNYKDNLKAIFTANGVAMLSVLKGLQHHNFKIPEDFYVCGFEDWGWATLAYKELPVISKPTYEVGAEAAKMMINKIESKKKAEPLYIELKSEIKI